MQKTISTKKYQEFLKWLKSQREEQGLTMRDLAALLDEPHQFVHKIETGERRLDVYEYVQYCQALDIEPLVGLKFLGK